MIQQTHQEQVPNNQVISETGSGIGQLLGTVLKACLRVIHKIVTNVVWGFVIFIDSAEKQGLPRN